MLLDRNMDLTTMLNHTWTYSTLVHDLLNMKLNRVVIFVSVFIASPSLNVFWMLMISTISVLGRGRGAEEAESV